MKSTHWMRLVIILLVFGGLTSCGQAAATPDPHAIKPSKPGDTGQALKLKGDVAQGKTLFSDKCSECHGDEGHGGVANPGSKLGAVPTLNPIDPTLYNADDKVFAANIDLFIEHGSVPAGTKPVRMMLGYGDNQILQPQQIADVMAYIISLNKK